jgi:hypothetical protein
MPCPICGNAAGRELPPKLGDYDAIHCPVCGEFEVTSAAREVMQSKLENHRLAALGRAKRERRPGKRARITEGML